MSDRNSAGKDLFLFLLGLGMCVGGLFLFTNQVDVKAFSMQQVNFFGLINAIPGGLIVIPLIIGIVIWIALPKIFVGQILTGIGALIIILGVISSVQLHFRQTSLFTYLLILILIFGGGALVLRTLLTPSGKD